MNRSRATAALVGASLALLLGVAPVAADHTYGVLDCGSAGTFDVEAASFEPLPKFEAPVPWSGLFLLEGTNQVYRAMSIETPRWSIVLAAAEKNPNATTECTLTSSGFNFEEPWNLEGVLIP
jgi:hypothetical protein